MPQAFKDGLWSNNPILVQMLGLCPALAVSTHLQTAFTLGLTTLLVLFVSMLLINFYRPLLVNHLRLPTFMLLIVGITALADLLLQAFAYPIYLKLGIFIPLITTNCILLAQAEVRASRLSLAKTFATSLSYGLGFLWVMIAMGITRELFSTGAIRWNKAVIVSLEPLQDFFGWQTLGLYPFMLPGGAFCTLAFFLVVKRYLARRRQSEPSFSHSLSPLKKPH